MTKEKELINKIETFIKVNGLDFSGEGSDLNSACVILAGYSLFIEIDESDLLDYLKNLPVDKFSAYAMVEFERVYEYAELENYGAWWYSNQAKREYKF